MMAKFEVGGSLTIKATVVSYKDDSPLIEASIFLCDSTGSSGGKTSVYVPVDQIASYQAATLAQRLAGLTVEQIEAALARKDSALADMIEEAGTKIARARRESGDLRRERKPKAEALPSAPNDAETSAASVAAIAGLEVTSYSLAEMAAKQGGKALAVYLDHIGEDAREEIREFMPEFLEIADAVDAEIAAKDKAARADGMQATAKVDIPF
jgi:hypothetical protein